MNNFLVELKIPGVVLIVVSIVYLTAQLGGDAEQRHFPANDPRLFRHTIRQAQSQQQDARVANYVYTDQQAEIDLEP